MKRIFQVFFSFIKRIGIRISFFLGFHLKLNSLDEPKEDEKNSKTVKHSNQVKAKDYKTRGDK